MHAWEQIQKTVDYIEEHIGEELSVEELCRMAALSEFYYQRLFSRLVKKPVMEYIKLRRMAIAASALLEGERRILDVALDFGFSSHEQFTRTFRETFDMTPEQYRKNPVMLNYMTKPELLLHYTLVDENAPLVTQGIVLEISRQTLSSSVPLLGTSVKAPVGLVEGLGIESGMDPLEEVWQSFHREKPRLAALLCEEEEIGVSLPCEEEGFFAYFAGAPLREGIEPPQVLPDGRVPNVWELPAGEYIVCTLEAESFEAMVTDALYKAQQYLYGVWLPAHGLLTEHFSAERYQTPGSGKASMQIWVKLVRCAMKSGGNC